jgi:RNA polymerase sigma-70 factor (ECF subfamily)
MPEDIQMFPSSLTLNAGAGTLDAGTLGAGTLGAEARATALDDIESVVALYQGRVHRFLLATLRDRDAAETLTQETFLRAWTARESFREDCSVATWLIRIALNLARDHTRTGRFRFWKSLSASAVDVTEIAANVPSGAGSAESQMIARQQVARIWETVGELSARQRTIFLLRFLEEMELPEIAAVTELPLGTVKSHLYRALAVIRERHGAANGNSRSFDAKNFDAKNLDARQKEAR